MTISRFRRVQALITILGVVAAGCGSTAQLQADGTAVADPGADPGLVLDDGGGIDDGLSLPPDGSGGGEPVADGGGGVAPSSGGGAAGASAGGSSSAAAAGSGGETRAARGGSSAGTSTAGVGTAQRSSGRAPGLTGTEIRIGFIYSENASAANDAAGLEGASRGDQRGYSELMVKWANEHGGIFGRKVVPVYHVYDGASTQSAPEQEQAACETFTQDNEVFAVASTGELTLNACLDKAGIPHFNVQGMRSSQEDVIAQWPRYFEVANVELNTVARSQIAGLHGQGYFKPRNPAEQVKIGLVRYDETGFKRAAREAFRPALKRHGLTLHAEAEISAPQSLDDYSSVGAQIQSAILRFQRDGINRVMFMEAAGDLALFWMNAAEGQAYRPRYGLTSNDAGELLADNVPHAQLNDAMGIGWSPGYDTRGKYALKAWPARKKCRKIYAQAGYEFADLNAEGVAMLQCDEMWFLQAAAGASASGATREGIVGGAERLGTSYQSAAGNGPTRFSPQRHFGITVYRNVAWFTGCDCFQYTSGPRKMLS